MKFSKPWYRKSRRAWFVTLGGRQIKLGKTKKEALDRYHELMAAPKKQKVPSDSLLALIDAFLDWVQRNRAHETYEWYRYRLQRFAEIHPDLRAGDLRPHHVESWAGSYEISITSRRNYLRAVKRCLKWAKKQGYIDQNPIEDLEVPAAEHKEIVITQAEYESLLSFIRNEQLRDLVVTTWETGCRPQELLRVEARHVDLENQRWVFPKSEAKSRRMSRVVYLTDKALLTTKRLMLAHPTGPLFRNGTGKPWTTDAVNCGILAARVRMLKADMKRAGEAIPEEAISELIPALRSTKISRGQVVEKTKADLRSEAKEKLTKRLAIERTPKYSLYALRHSWATHALQKGMDPLTVAILMGHEDPSMLSKVYQHLSLDPKHMLNQAKRAAG